MRATTIEGQNAFAPSLCWCALRTLHVRDCQFNKTRVIRLRVIEGPN